MSRDKLVGLLTELIAIPSVNPEDTPDASICGELRLASFVSGYLAELGFSVRLCEKTPNRPNVIAEYGPEKARKTILFESHLDTVGVGSMKRPPFKAEVIEGKVYGRGACDTKGPMAAGLCALSQGVLDQLAEAGCRVIFVGAMGEEKGNVGAMQLVEEGVRADEIIVLEPTNLQLVHAHKGTLWLTIHVFGLAAHGSNPDRGKSAILGMQAVIEMLHRQITQDRIRFRDPVLGLPTLNIGKIEGGAAVNIVPDRCRIEIDRRTLPGADFDEALPNISAGMRKLCSEGVIEGFDLEIIKNGTPFQTRADSSLVKSLMASLQRCGQRAEAVGAGWYSDAGPLSAACRDIVVFGPGRIEEAHTADEHIELDSLHAGYEVIKDYLVSCAQREE
jgi:acetylornithine deacetylase/succinyl-diaminopimelate desuccinylase family protein